MSALSANRQRPPKIHTYVNDFCFSTPYYCTANPPTDIHSSMCCSSFVSVALTCPLFLQIGNTLRKSWHGSDKRKYNMWAWLWVGQWVWPVEKWSDITSKPHIIFLSRDTIFGVHPVLNPPESNVLVKVYMLLNGLEKKLFTWEYNWLLN